MLAGQLTYIPYKQEQVYLGGKPGTERAVFFRSNDGKNVKVEIQRLVEKTGLWNAEYIKEFENIPDAAMLAGYFEAARCNAVLLYTLSGNDRLLSYTVVGRKKDGLSELIERKNIFQGGIRLESGKLIEAEGNQFKAWLKTRSGFSLERIKAPRIPDAVIIPYAITGEGRIELEKQLYTVPVGTAVQIVRTDRKDIRERIMFTDSPNLRFLQHMYAFKAVAPGKTELTIIPGDYEWDNAVRVVIEAE